MTSAVLIEANAHVLHQGAALLMQLDDEQYTLTAAPLFAYGVGSHMRHCLDTYECILRGLPAGRVDYDRRERDELTARNRRHARTRLLHTLSRLQQIARLNAHRPLLARQDSPQWTPSSLGRELQMALSHTVHHFALVALILRLQGVAVADDFGVAPSTLQHWQQPVSEVVCVQ